MAYRPAFGSKRRERLWLRERDKAYLAGRGTLPICPHCGEPVADRDWHEAHVGVPRWLGGRATAVAHAACNLADGRQVVTPAYAKSNRVRARAEGRKGPGLGRYPMRAGRLSSESKTFRRGVVRRQSLADKHAATMARRGVLTQQTEV